MDRDAGPDRQVPGRDSDGAFDAAQAAGYDGQRQRRRRRVRRPGAEDEQRHVLGRDDEPGVQQDVSGQPVRDRDQPAAVGELGAGGQGLVSHANNVATLTAPQSSPLFPSHESSGV